MNFEHGGNIIHISKKLGLKDTDLFDFSVNINPLGFPEILKKTILENINKITLYPEINSNSLKEKIAYKLNCSSSNIVVGNGSNQLIYSIPNALSIKSAIIVEPTFSEYRSALERYNCKILSYKLNEQDDFILNINALKTYLKSKNFDALFLCNPNNPNGIVVNNKNLKLLAEFFEKKEKYLIIDEAFIDFTDENGLSFSNFKYTIILKSLTKIFAIPGLRLGYLKADKFVAKHIEKYIEPWSVNIFSQLIGEKLLKLDNFIENTKKFLEKEREFVIKELSEIKELKIFPSCTNYLLIKILTSANVNQLEKYLLKNKILIRNCSNFNGLNNKFFRISINSRNANKKLIMLLKEFLKNIEQTF
jgi:threonine-phosphate decarboxylase